MTVGRILAIAAAVAAWLLAAVLLWHSAVPGGLDLPSIDADAVFGSKAVAEAERYERVVHVLWLANVAVLLVTFVLYARYGFHWAKESAAGPIGTGMLLGMLGFGLVWLAQLPMGLIGHWWDRKHDLTDEGYLSWAVANWFWLGPIFVALCFQLLVMMALARRFRRWWWVPSAAIFGLLVGLVSFVSPYLLAPGSDSLRDPELVAAARQYERKQSLSGPIALRVQDVSDFTNQPNAFAAGFGPTRQVVVWNTLLDGRFDKDEVKVVLAHEIGHHSSNHIWKSIWWYLLFALPTGYVLARITRRRGGMGEAAAVPLALLVLVVVGLVTQPFDVAISRHMEAEADWKALESTRDPAAAERLFGSFGDTTLSDPSPPGWAHVLFDTHPTLEQRVAMARAWAEKGGDGSGSAAGEPRDAPRTIEVLPNAVSTVDLSAYQVYEVSAASPGDVRRLRTAAAPEYEPRRNARGDLLFVSNVVGNDEIYLDPAGPRGPVRLTHNPAPDYDPAWSPDGSRIAWVRIVDGTGDLWTMAVDGSGDRVIVTDRDAQNPDWSPDGRTLAFWQPGRQSDRTWVVPATGGSSRLVGSGAFPSWAPDGQRLVVEAADGLAVIRTDSSERSIVDQTMAGDGMPSWSPSGDRIVFVSEQVDDNGDIWTITPNGEDIQVLTSDSAIDLNPDWTTEGDAVTFTSDRDSNSEIAVGQPDGGAVFPAPSAGWDGDATWSPDGQRIVFVSDRTGDDEIWAVNPDGSGLARLTDHPGSDSAPDWGRDGILFSREDTEDADVWQMNADGSDAHRVTGSDGWDGDADWSPDAERIVYARQVSGDDEEYELRAVESDGSGDRLLLAGPGSSDGPAWSPGGSLIAFESDRSGAWEIWLVRADGSELRKLTASGLTAEYPSWAPDGRSVVYDVMPGASRIVRVRDLATGKDVHVGRGASQWLAEIRPGSR